MDEKGKGQSKAIDYSVFAFSNSRCEIQVIQDFSKYGEKQLSLNIIETEDTIDFAYKPGRGLIYLGDDADTKVGKKRGKKREVAPFDFLQGLNRLKNEDLYQFIKEYGFFVRLKNTDLNAYTRVSMKDIKYLLYRMRLFQRLLEQVDEVKRNKGNKYGQLLEVVSESLFIDRAAPVFEERNFFDLHFHRFSKIRMERNLDTGGEGTYRVYDYLRNEEVMIENSESPYHLENKLLESGDIESYMKLRNGSISIENGQNALYPEDRELLFELYRDTDSIDRDLKLIVDFFYNFFKDFQGCYKTADDVQGQKVIAAIDNNPLFDNRYKSVLEEIARRLIKEEMEYYIQKVRLVMNKDTLLPDYEVPDLLTAFYLSALFSRRLEIENYEQRECPKCHKLFYCKSTSKQQYCDDKCRVAFNQAKHREKKKQEQKKEQSDR